MSDNGYLTRDAILRGPKLKTQNVNVPEFGGIVRVRELTAGERDSLESKLFSSSDAPDDKYKDLRATLVSMSVVDEAGKNLFTEKDIPELSAKSARGIDRIFSVAQLLSGLTPSEVDELVKK